MNNGIIAVTKDPRTCKHEMCIPAFDEKVAEGLSSEEIKRKWPRFGGLCPECGSNVIAYASAMHYISGDW